MIADPQSREYQDIPSESLLVLHRVSKAFPGVQALFEVDFDVRPGEVHVLLGENGAGKSTLIKIIAGVIHRDGGQVFWLGHPFEMRNPLSALHAGISVIYQELSLVPRLDVANNVFLGRTPVVTSALGRFVGWKDKSMYSKAEELLSGIAPGISPATLVADLTVAQQQMVEIVRALSVNSRVILMDEPTSSLGPEDKERLFEIIRALKERGIGIVYVSHILEEVMEIGDRVTVLRDGVKIGTRSIAEVTIDALIRMMIGRTLKERYPKIEGNVAEPVLEVKGLTKTGSFDGVSFSLKRGEVLGLAGLVGSGRTELARALLGLERLDKGEVIVDGERVTLRTPQAAIARGIALVPEDRKTQGIFGLRSVHDNITIGALNQRRTATAAGLVRLHHLVRFRTSEELCRRLVNELRIKTPSLKQRAEFLSGGNQQKTLLARWLSTKTKVLILDEPTRGIDAGSKIEIYQIIERLAKSGVGIIVISSELPEVVSICTRVLVMRLGRVTGEFPRETATEHAIMLCAAAGNDGGSPRSDRVGRASLRV